MIYVYSLQVLACMQDLDVCSNYAESHNVQFNWNKSVEILFPPIGFIIFRKPINVVLGKMLLTLWKR